MTLYRSRLPHAAFPRAVRARHRNGVGASDDAHTSAASAARLRAIMDGVGEGIITYRADGTIELLNPAAERLFGCRGADVVGQNIAGFIPDRISRLSFTPYSILGQAGVSGEISGLRPDGSDVFLNITSSGIRGTAEQSHDHFVAVVRDITEIRVSERASRQREQEFRALVESAPDSIMRFDADCRHLYVNPAVEGTFGFTPAEMLGRTVAEVGGNTLTSAIWQAQIRQVFDTGVETTFEFGLLDEGGTGQRWFQTRIAPEFDANRNCVSVLAMSRDITERKRVEEALQWSEDRFRNAFDGVPIGMTLSLPDGKLIRANPALCRMFGYTEAELLERSIQSLTHPDDFDEDRTAMHELIAGRLDVVEMEKRYFRGDGSIVHTHLSISAISGDETHPSLLVAHVQDITDRKRAEQDRDRLFRAEEQARGQMHAVLDSAGELMLLISPDRQIALVNERSRELLGIEPDRLIGRRLDEIHGLLQHVFGGCDDFETLVADLMTDDERQITDVLAQRWPHERELELYSTPVRAAAGDYLGRLFVLRDVTQQREVDRMKSEFVSHVSHELRTPLTSIAGFVDLILEGEAGEINESQHKFLSIVSNNANRLVDLINDLLDISRIDAGRIDIIRVPLDLAELVSNASTTLFPQFDARRQQLDFDIPHQLPVVWGDGERVLQILTNLLSNACKYTPEGGQVRISAETRGEHVLVSVTDSGIGMSADELAQLFTRFYRVNNELTQQVGGTGLGLAITRSLVELHGGEITVTSTPREGSTFTFTLPTRASVSNDARALIEVRDA